LGSSPKRITREREANNGFSFLVLGRFIVLHNGLLNKKHYLWSGETNQEEMNLIETNIQRIIDLCKKHKVNKLFVFGSILTCKFNDQSDIDFVVDFSKIDLAEYVNNYFDLKESLQKLLGRDIDLLEDKAINNPVLRRNIDRTKQLIYG
jgi:predicted nucleotidyltransferase